MDLLTLINFIGAHLEECLNHDGEHIRFEYEGTRFELALRASQSTHEFTSATITNMDALEQNKVLDWPQRQDTTLHLYKEDMSADQQRWFAQLYQAKRHYDTDWLVIDYFNKWNLIE